MLARFPIYRSDRLEGGRERAERATADGGRSALAQSRTVLLEISPGQYVINPPAYRRELTHGLGDRQTERSPFFEVSRS
jgi:hypothetical protein